MSRLSRLNLKIRKEPKIKTKIRIVKLAKI